MRAVSQVFGIKKLTLKKKWMIGDMAKKNNDQEGHSTVASWDNERGLRE
jgi:hypothetical protein